MTKKPEDPIGERAIPTPPSGGSWAFDRTKWNWVPKELADQPAESTKE